MRDWYIIDTRTNTIINCVTTLKDEPQLEGWPHAEHLRLELNPTPDQLFNYQYRSTLF